MDTRVNINDNDLEVKAVDRITGEPIEQTPEELAKAKADIQRDLSNLKCDPSDYEQVKSHLRAQLVNQKSVRTTAIDGGEFSFPVIADMVGVVRIDLGKETTGAIVVTNNMVDSWGITPEQLMDDAVNNTPLIDDWSCFAFNIFDMGAARTPGVGTLPKDPAEGMILLTNVSGCRGAAALFSKATLNEVHKQIDDFFILPSSVHELILVPCEAGNIDDLKAMVKNINATTVSPADFLSDTVLVYNGECFKEA